MLISANVSFECIQQQIDREGRFVFLLCKLNGFRCIIAAMYIPPPFSAVPLKSLAQFMALHPNLPVLVLGDFNNILDSHLVRMSVTPRSTRPNVGKAAFASLLTELGLHDV